MNLREIDRLVAEKVMGAAVRVDGECVFSQVANGLWREWRPTEDIAAAWEVLAKLPDADLVRWDCPSGSEFVPGWACTNVGVQTWMLDSNEYEPGRYGAVALTAPLAICLAALKAKGVEVPS